MMGDRGDGGGEVYETDTIKTTTSSVLGRYWVLAWRVMSL